MSKGYNNTRYGMKTLNILIMISISFFFKADTVRLPSEPIKSNFSFSETITLMDEMEGYYDNIFSNVMPNGNYVVLDVGNKLVFVYDKSGKEITSFGKEGNGPGEFNRPNRLFTAKNRIIVSEWGRTQLFDQNGKFVSSIAARWSQPMVTSNGISFISFGGERAKNIMVTYDFDGKLVKETPNPEFNKEAAEQGRRGWNSERFKEMMTRPRGLTMFGNSFVQYYPGVYKFELLDKSLKPQTTVTKDFSRVKEDPEEVAERWNRRGRRNNSKEAQQRRAQMMAQRAEITGGYLDDISYIAGIDNNHVFMKTATESKSELNIDVISEDLKYIGKIVIKGDEVLSASVNHGKLFVNFTNDEDGPYAKVYDLKF